MCRGDLLPWNTVERSHEEIGDGEVEQKVIGDAPHGPVRQDDPQHHRVPHYRNHNDHWEEESPDDLVGSPRQVLLVPESIRIELANAYSYQDVATYIDTNLWIIWYVWSIEAMVNI